MRILALEQSTNEGSVAVLRDETVSAQRTWEEKRRRKVGGSSVFSELTSLLDSAELTAADIELFAVGLGPGVFSGLRISLAVAQALALPGRVPVRGVPSGDALALQIRAETRGSRFTIVGDARRSRLWIAQFAATGDELRTTRHYSLLERDHLRAALRRDDVLASPDWDRLGSFLRDAVPAGVELVEQKCLPAGAAVGLLAFRRYAEEVRRAGPTGSHNAHRTMPALEPIYLHPPVYLEPRSTPP